MPAPIVGPGMPCPHHGFSGHPLGHDPLKDTSGNARKSGPSGSKAAPSKSASASKRTHSEANPEKPPPPSKNPLQNTTGPNDNHGMGKHVEDDLSDHQNHMDCNQIRQKIKTLLNSGGMNEGEFHELLGISGTEYNQFMKQRGKLGGNDSKVFQNAKDFFKRREVNGTKEPAPKKRRTSNESAKGDKSDASNKKTQNKGGIPDLADIHVDGEDTDAVPIYDSCGEIRKKITNYLRREGVEQSKLLRAFKEQYHTDKQPSRMDSEKLKRFRGAKGADGGNTNSIYYAAYVFFEKLRIKEGKPKSKHRQDMEEAWPDGANTTVAASNRHVTLMAGESATKDRLGRFHVKGRF